MVETPENTIIPRIRLNDEKNSIVECIEVLRALHGKRLVCRGQWQQQQVVVKLFLDKQRHDVHYLRELKGVETLLRRNIATPKILYSGKSKSLKKSVIILEYIENSVNAKQLWEKTCTSTDKIKVLRHLVMTLAKHHQEGLLQTDLHLANFLFANHQVYSLDGAGFKISSKPINKTQSWDNLGWLFAQIYPYYDELLTQVFADYCHIRQWLFSEKEQQKVFKIIHHNRRLRLEHFLKKTLRDCSEFVHLNHKHGFTIVNRDYYNKEIGVFLSNPNASLNHESCQFLKQGNTCTVWKVTIAGHDLVVKRYNIKNIWQGVNKSWRPHTRASISWQHAHRLRFYGIETPTPVALIEKNWGSWDRVSYFISVYQQGEALLDWMQYKQGHPEEINAMIAKIKTLFYRLYLAKISHGDMKATNFLVTADKLQLIDLDAVQQHRFEFCWQASIQRDWNRFLKNWQDFPQILEQLQA